MQTLKLSARTITILKNFTYFNPSILFRPGNKISTMPISKSVMARATIPESFETGFAIYDLSRFLGVLSMFTDPELQIGEHSVLIKEGRRKTNYVFADPSTIVSAPDKEIKLPSEDIKFILTTDIWAQVQKALGVLKAPHVSVAGDGELITINALDAANPTGDVFSVEVGETTDTFSQVFNTEHLKLLPADYEWIISSQGISRLSTTDLVYYVATQKGMSSFGA